MGKKPKSNEKKSGKFMWVSDRTHIVSKKNFYKEESVKYVHIPVFMLVLFILGGFIIGEIVFLVVSDDVSDQVNMFHLGKERVLENQLQAQKQTTYECLLLLKDIQYETLDDETPIYVRIPETSGRDL